MVAQLQGWLLIRFTTDDNQTAYMQPVGSGDEIAALEALAADAEALGTPLRRVSYVSTNNKQLSG